MSLLLKKMRSTILMFKAHHMSQSLNRHYLRNTLQTQEQESFRRTIHQEWTSHIAHTSAITVMENIRTRRSFTVWAKDS